MVEPKRERSAEILPRAHEHEIGAGWGGVPESAREFSTSQLRKAIRTGELEGGEVLREEEWSARLGVSRTPLREAIAELCMEGLLRKDGRSVYVYRPSLSELFEIYDIREQLEVLAAQRAVVNAEADVFGKLHSLKEEITVIEVSDEWSAKHEAFHMCIIEASQMPRLVNLVASLRSQSEPYVRMATSFDPDFRARAAQQHREIFELFVSGDRAGIGRMIRKHLRATRHQVEKMVSMSGQGARMMGPRLE
jgi:DNA-binding GntR family transcriptional regulator